MKPRALDLYCCAGGASKGLADAGFEVTGVDIEDQPNYPFPERFIKASALSLDVNYLRQFDLIWASPPCQGFTAYKRRTGHVKPRINMIPSTRKLLQAAGVPFIIENVEGARAELHNPITLCGSMFGLDVRRHRCFETSYPIDPLAAPKCNHRYWDRAGAPRFPGATNRAPMSRKTVEVGVWRIPLETQMNAMRIDWMPVEKLSQAIPPAFSKWLAEQAILAMRHTPALAEKAAG